VVILDLDETEGPTLAHEVGAVFVRADVTDPDDVQAVVERATALAPLRVLVNCAGVGDPGRTLNRDGEPLDLARFERIIRINLIGTFNTLRLSAAAMARTERLADGERGAIVNTASLAAFDGQIGQASYSASKGGIVGMTLPVARDLGSAGIRVNTIAPGLIDTPIYGNGAEVEAFKEKLAAHVVFPRRLGAPDEFASLALELITNSYMNAEVIRLDAGARLPPR
jgi:NAD(P)-dependent dehydrogenase (short-subunit alcohol dehydrogenase family)